MSDGIAGLARAFEVADQLNREALSALRAGQALSALQPLFDRKAVVEADLARLLPHLQGIAPDAVTADSLGAALLAQSAAARSETQLAEALTRLVSLDGKMRDAYQQNPPLGVRQRWESKG